MLQLQYYNSGLKNNHINKILNNYRMKYTHIKNEIESKINQMIKFFLKDILVFLENIEEVSNQKHKINEYESVLKELEITRAKIKDKISAEYKLKNECEMLQQENCLLKLKINSLNYKINNLTNLNNYNSQESSPIRIKSNNSTTMNIYSNSQRNFMSPKPEKLRNLLTEFREDASHNKTRLLSPNNELSKSLKTRENIDKLALKINYGKMIKSKNNFKNKKKKINVNKYVNNKTLIKGNKNDNLKKFNINKKENIRKKFGSIINNLPKNKKKYSSAEKIKPSRRNKYSPINTINQSTEPINNNDNIDYENLEKKVNDVLESEMKELEQDEANIEFLLEQLVNLNSQNYNNN